MHAEQIAEQAYSAYLSHTSICRDMMSPLLRPHASDSCLIHLQSPQFDKGMENGAWSWLWVKRSDRLFVLRLCMGRTPIRAISTCTQTQPEVICCMHNLMQSQPYLQYIRLYSQGLLDELALVPGWMLILDHRAANNMGDELFCFGGLYFSPRILREFCPYF